MPFAIKTRLEGVEELVHKLDGLKRSLARKYIRSAMRKSCSVVNKTAKQNVTVGATGALKKSLGVKVKVYPSGIVVGIVEPRSGYADVVGYEHTAGGTIDKLHDPQRIAHLVERGTVQRRIRTMEQRARVAKLSDLIRQAKRINDRFEQRRVTKALRIRRRMVGFSGANRGTMPARPFLYPALTANLGRIEQIFAEEVDKALESV